MLIIRTSLMESAFIDSSEEYILCHMLKSRRQVRRKMHKVMKIRSIITSDWNVAVSFSNNFLEKKSKSK